jgi:hypothetical protein
LVGLRHRIGIRVASPRGAAPGSRALSNVIGNPPASGNGACLNGACLKHNLQQCAELLASPEVAQRRGNVHAETAARRRPDDFVCRSAGSQVPNPCPPTAAPSTSTTGTGAPGSDGIEPPERQPIERSAILPDAGGENQSAAPTVQQDGKSVEAQTDCPKLPNQPDVPKPPSR